MIRIAYSSRGYKPCKSFRSLRAAFDYLHKRGYSLVMDGKIETTRLKKYNRNTNKTTYCKIIY